MIVFEKQYYDSGNCRTYYHIKGDKLRPPKLYCRYDNTDEMLVCSRDGEPSHSIGNTAYVRNDRDPATEKQNKPVTTLRRKTHDTDK